MNGIKITMLLIAGVVFAGTAQAAWVEIGDVGNPETTFIDYSGHTVTYGAVDYEYRIGKFEVSIAEFQMAVGAGGGKRETFWNDGIGTGADRTVGSDAPVCNVNLYEAMKYCNWRTSGNINNGLYQNNGDGTWGIRYDRSTAIETLGTFYAVPTDDEWFKAAYWTGSGYSLYADGTNVQPMQDDGTGIGWNYDYAYDIPNQVRKVTVGALEQNGTVNMMGNVAEWTEGEFPEIRYGGYRGGSYIDSHMQSTWSGGGVTLEAVNVGFRVVQIPEPSSIAMISLVSGCAVFVRRWFGR